LSPGASGLDVADVGTVTNRRFTLPELVYVPEPCTAHEVLELMVGRMRRAGPLLPCLSRGVVRSAASGGWVSHGGGVPGGGPECGW
jgi:hypothetical protein